MEKLSLTSWFLLVLNTRVKKKIDLVASIIGSFESLASQNQAKMKNLLLVIKTTVKIGLGTILEKLTQHHNRREQNSLDDHENERCVSTQFLQIKKNQLIDLQKHLGR